MLRAGEADVCAEATAAKQAIPIPTLRLSFITRPREQAPGHLVGA
jgi:hypothetical protein